MRKIFQWKTLRWVLRILLFLSIVIQFIPVKLDNPALEGEVPAPAEVRAILRRSCYDCHSNETVWPWYGRIAPASWLLAHDVHEGREELNFSTWNRYRPEKQREKLAECWEEVAEGEMPLPIYLRLHPKARLSEQDRAVLKPWALPDGAGKAKGGEPDGHEERERE